MYKKLFSPKNMDKKRDVLFLTEFFKENIS